MHVRLSWEQLQVYAFSRQQCMMPLLPPTPTPQNRSFALLNCVSSSTPAVGSLWHPAHSVHPCVLARICPLLGGNGHQFQVLFEPESKAAQGRVDVGRRSPVHVSRPEGGKCDAGFGAGARGLGAGHRSAGRPPMDERQRQGRSRAARVVRPRAAVLLGYPGRLR